MVTEGLRIRTVIFYDSGDMMVEYMVPRVDVRTNGLTFNHTAYLPIDAYDDEIQSVRSAVKAALKGALQDSLDIPAEPVEEPEPDEVGPYEYPPGEGPRTEE